MGDSLLHVSSINYGLSDGFILCPKPCWGDGGPVRPNSIHHRVESKTSHSSNSAKGWKILGFRIQCRPPPNTHRASPTCYALTPETRTLGPTSAYAVSLRTLSQCICVWFHRYINKCIYIYRYRIHTCIHACYEHIFYLHNTCIAETAFTKTWFKLLEPPKPLY